MDRTVGSEGSQGRPSCQGEMLVYVSANHECVQSVIGHVSYRNVSKMCQIMFGLHLYYRTFTSGSGGVGGRSGDDNAAKPATAVQVCVSTSVNLMSLSAFT